MTPKVLTADELVRLDLPPRQMLLAPWLPEAGLAMIYAARGVGKSHLALGIAKAVAIGEDLLGWNAGDPRNVLYVDGEMQGAQLRERVVTAVGSAPPDRLRFLVADLQPRDLPCLTTAEGQKVFTQAAEAADLIILDNLASLVRRGDENDAEAWRTLQHFLLGLRRAGKSVLVVHHSGKGGDQRGTSAREDVMDTVMKLAHPDDYAADEGAWFEVHFTKTRGFFGAQAAPFEARLDAETGAWLRSPIRRSAEIALMQSMRAEGKTLQQIAEVVGVDKSTVSRRLRAVEGEVVARCTP